VLAAHAKGFFTIPHDDGSPAVLIQLRAVGTKALREAITNGWRVPRSTSRRGSSRVDQASRGTSFSVAARAWGVRVVATMFAAYPRYFSR